MAITTAATLSRQVRGKRSMILICLLLIDVEMNPCPTRRATRPTNAAGARNITVGALNARSMVNKAAEIHLTIEDERLDVLAVS